MSVEQDASARERRLLQAHVLRAEQRVVHGGVALDRLREPLSVLLATPLQPDGRWKTDSAEEVYNGMVVNQRVGVASGREA